MRVVCVCVCSAVCVCVKLHCQFVLGIYAETIGASFGFVLIHYRHYRYFQLSKDRVLFKVYHQVCKVQEFIMSIHNLQPPPIWCVC